LRLERERLMPTFQIRVDFGPEYGGEVGVQLRDAETAEAALLAYLHNKLQATRHPPLKVPERIVESNGTSKFISHGVVYRALPVPDRSECEHEHVISADDFEHGVAITYCADCGATL
jgi:hypothetical protein